MKTRMEWLLPVLLLLFFAGACQPVTRIIKERQAAATVEAEQYPWAVYPISEGSKQALCEALDLSADDPFCEPERPVKHWDVYRKVKKLFPPGTPYEEVEAKLGRFPHVKEESRQPDGTLVGLRYVYQLTEYEGACIYFEVDPNGEIIKDVDATRRDTSAPQRTKCGPADRPGN